MNKELIKKRFEKNLDSYNENARIQKQMANKLFSFLESDSEKQVDSILEIGCGTGLLTEIAINNLKFKNYTTIDIVSKCENYIKKIDPNINFICSDAENYVEISPKYDLIISNASLQWIENLPDFINKLYNHLNNNRKLIFSIFGKENYREINSFSENTLNYYSKTEIEKFFSKYSAEIEEEIRIMAFKTPKDVLKHIHSTGVNAISSKFWTKKDLNNFEKQYNNFCSNIPTLTYNPIYIKIHKK